MVTMTRNFRHLLLSRGGSGRKTIAPILGGFLGGAGFFLTLLAASYGWELIVGLF